MYLFRKFIKVIRVKKVELCSILNGTSTNFVVNTIIDIIKDSIPSSIHACPYIGKLEIFNVTLDSAKFPSIFPSGTYRSRVHYYDDMDPNIYTLSTYTTCRSNIKSSF